VKREADKNPEKLFDLDADALSFATVHNRHLQPTFKLDEGEEDDESEGLPPHSQSQSGDTATQEPQPGRHKER